MLSLNVLCLSHSSPVQSSPVQSNLSVRQFIGHVSQVCGLAGLVCLVTSVGLVVI